MASLVASGTGVGSGPTVSLGNTTGADFIIVGANGQIGPSPNTISDTYGNTWTQICNFSDLQGLTLIAWYCQAPTVGAGHSITYSTNNSNESIWALAFSGSVASPLDGTESHDSDGTPGSKTPSQNNCVVVTGFSAAYTLTACACTSPFDTTATLAGGGGANWASGYAYEIQSTATARSPTWTGTSAGINGSFIVVFKFSGGAPATKAPPFFSNFSRPRFFTRKRAS
jgi:hypothetical protein